MENIQPAQETTSPLSRRRILKTLLAAGVLGSGATVLQRTAAAQGGDVADYETLRKVLVERLLNTRYHVSDEGALLVMLGDEVWPGDGGGAAHADWLFNAQSGLKVDPHVALEQTIVTDIVHEGVPQGWNLEAVERIVNDAESLGLFDSINLVYQVLREKVHVETHGAHEAGVHKFTEWVNASSDFTTSEKNIINQATSQYMQTAVTQTDHDWY